MSGPKRAGKVYRLYWILDLTTDSSRCYVSLLFKDTQTQEVLIDTVPPELLSYCTVGSYFLNGKKVDRLRHPDGHRLEFTIDSAAGNLLIETSGAFSDAEYNLTFNEESIKYSDICKKQFCFVQQVGDTKIVIPSFAIASAYYFKSSSLRHAILSRNLESLFYNCNKEDGTRHAVIEMKPFGNLGDAKAIARFKLDDVASRNMKVCMNHLYANKNAPYKRLKFSFPVEQLLTIKARGYLTKGASGNKTFIVYQILREDSCFPFDSLEIIYEKEEPKEIDDGESVKFPVTKTKHTGHLSDSLPSGGLVRHLLESSDKVENPNEKKIGEIRTAVPKPPEEKTSQIVYDERETDISLQPGTLDDGETSRGSVKEENEHKPKQASSLANFKPMVDSLSSFSETMTLNKVKVLIQVTGYKYTEQFVWKRKQSKVHLTMKESYDNTPQNRRNCAYVSFMCHDRYVWLVEIDQVGLPGNGCSTMVLISKKEISKDSAESVVKDFVQAVTHEKIRTRLGSSDIIFETKNHPEDYEDTTTRDWRNSLLRKVLKN